MDNRLDTLARLVDMQVERLEETGGAELKQLVWDALRGIGNGDYEAVERLSPRLASPEPLEKRVHAYAAFEALWNYMRFAERDIPAAADTLRETIRVRLGAH